MMGAELDLLQSAVARQVDVYQRCDTSVLPSGRRLLVQAWLAEVGLLVAALQRQLAQITDHPSAGGMQQAWTTYGRVLSTLSPLDEHPQPRVSGEAPEDAVASGLRTIGNRLVIVFTFLVLQLLGGVLLLVLVTRIFTGFDPQTALTPEQWHARRPARAELQRVRTMLEDAQKPAAAAPSPIARNATAAPVATGPDVPALRGELEGLSATLADLRLATSDLKMMNTWINTALASLNTEPANFAGATTALLELDRFLSADQDKAPPSIIILTILGSLLGMITITIHLNWKFRNRWDTVGFLPWYITKLIAAPAISLAAVGLLSQVTFTKDLGSATGIGSLGLMGASPMLVFSVAILFGLFSNKVFDWLRSIASSTSVMPGAAKPSPIVKAQGEDLEQDQIK